jgi:hypothetical protein
MNVGSRMIMASTVRVAGISPVINQVIIGSMTIATRFSINNWFGSTDINMSDMFVLAVEVKVSL